MIEKKKQEIPMFGLDDFFKSQAEKEDERKEKIETIDISLLDDFKDHPFKVIENLEFQALKKSIENSGITNPLIVRQKTNGRYELISGHRRKKASLLLGLDSVPCIVRNLTDDEAVVCMVDSNFLQRENLLPSEKAYAYKMKYEAIKHQGKRSDLTSGPLVHKLKSSDIIGEEEGESGRQIRRYIRLTYLIPELLQLVDNSELGETPKMALRPAIEISFLKNSEQQILLEFINQNLANPSHEQAIQLRGLSENSKLDNNSLYKIMDKLKPNQITNFKINEEKLYKVLPSNIKQEKIEDYILNACEFYKKHLRNKERER